MSKQFLLAHRGYSAIAPENTELSFDIAERFGFDGIEIDVHLTKDNQLVIIHDETTGRTAGFNCEVNKVTLGELRSLDLAKNFVPGSMPQQIMTLEEFYDRYLHVEHFRFINVEIKTDIIHYEGIEQRIHELSIKYPEAKDKIIFSSFNFDSLVKMRELDKEWKLGFLFWTRSQLEAIDPKKIKSICQFIHPWTKIYDKMKKEILAFKKPLCLWTIRDRKKYEQYLEDDAVYVQISNYKF
ncbi:glycerophosphoryl diester phosphodiesterase [Mycoplasmoides fastidiosum]|uniref:Glycerophosphoryl diester phosphodiesterase n=2 Tax=Mycoplasmoides fastidiosum TaxID=92758 RepID=A0ABU0LYF5_9BACT|nr:glycerophosphodiester phosphodiesterase family protein [Mycoplasmoides fastidiosum]MDQ0513722.1 glycerophosphoryl diester phosphodiesterase [Mycoplasmoides fastidiosum]